MLVILGGLPATGKTTLARAVSRRLGGVHVRVDTIEQALVDSGLAFHPGVAGYAVAYALAVDHLRQGLAVVADSVNPIAASREAWRAVATQAGSHCVQVEVVCTDAAEHHRRATRRTSDIAGLQPPSWTEIVDREYEPWRDVDVVVDTASRSVDEAVGVIVDAAQAAVRH